MMRERSTHQSGQPPSIAETVSLAKQVGTITDRARVFAWAAHQGQQCDDGRPYPMHPEEVVAILHADGVKDPIVLAAAYLHDVLEHTQTTHATLLAEFGPEVADLVMMLTNPEQPGRTFSERHADLVQLARRMTPPARYIKLADRLANLSSMACWTASERRAYAEVTIPLLDALRPWPSERLARQIEHIVQEAMDQPLDAQVPQH